MITHASQLLEMFIKEEKQKLEGVEMPHMPTLGDAYEEITKQGIDQEFIVPKALNLKIVKGFIEIAGQLQSEQIDCMLVEGEGKQFGRTESYIYDIEKVLCIFEVKKTLNKSVLSDAFEHLRKTRKRFSENFEKKLKSGAFEPDILSARKSFAQITGKMAPTSYFGIHDLPKPEGILFYTLVQEQHAPVSIVHGYSGYKTESGLRSSFASLLEDRLNAQQKPIGIPSLPSLVTSNNFCLIKGNGQPYLAMRGNQSFAAVFSTRHNAARIILEVLWAKIASYCNVKMPYGLDLDIESVVPLLVAEPCEVSDKGGWIYNLFEYSEQTLERKESSPWEPARVRSAEMSAVHVMAFNGGYLTLDTDLDKYLQEEHNQTLEEVVKNLLETRLFALEDNSIRPIAHSTHILSCEDGSGFVSNERDRFDAWCDKNSIRPNYLTIAFVDPD